MAGEKKKGASGAASLRRELKAAEARHQTAKREARQAKDAAREAKRDVKRLRKMLEKTAASSASKKKRKSPTPKNRAARVAPTQTSGSSTRSKPPRRRTESAEAKVAERPAVQDGEAAEAVVGEESQ